MDPDEIERDGKGLARACAGDVILGTRNSVDAMADSVAGTCTEDVDFGRCSGSFLLFERLERGLWIF